MFSEMISLRTKVRLSILRSIQREAAGFVPNTSGFALRRCSAGEVEIGRKLGQQQ